MGCHIIDPVVWILDLGPAKGVSYEGPKPKPETFPATEILTYRFAGTEYTAKDELVMKWWDGGQRPTKKGTHLPKDTEVPSQGAMFIGEKGTVLCPHGGMPRLWLADKSAKYERPRIDRLDHYKVWLDAFATGEKPNSHFGYAGPLTETVLLGVVTARIGANEEILWDSENLRFTNSPKANKFIRPKYRKGWEVEGLG